MNFSVNNRHYLILVFIVIISLSSCDDSYERCEYHEDGTLKVCATYVDRLLNGSTCYFDSTGKITELSIFKDGKRHGRMIRYYPNGKKKMHQDYVYDKKHGNYQEFTSNGVLIAEASYSDGYLNGVYSTYYESGVIESSIPYFNGKIEGKCYQYYENGQLRLITYHNHDTILAYKEFNIDGLLVDERINIAFSNSTEYCSPGVPLKINFMIYSIDAPIQINARLFSNGREIDRLSVEGNDQNYFVVISGKSAGSYLLNIEIQSCIYEDLYFNSDCSIIIE